MYKVFLVDDEPFIVEGLADAVDWSALGLELAGSAPNGSAALQALERTPVDILITDISMPIMTGLELIPRAREFLPGLKVVILSGFNEFDYLKEGMKLGIENYLLKPINFEELRETLSAAIDKLNSESPSRAFGPHEIGILKDNILYRWLTGKITASELEDRAALLQLDLYGYSYATVAILSSNEAPSSLFDAANRMLGNEEALLLFRDIEDQTVIVFQAAEADAGKREAIRMLGRLRGALSEEIGDLQVSVGSAETADRAPASYENAIRARQYFLVRPGGSFIDYDLVSSRSDNGAQAFPLDWESYSKLIASKDVGELEARIDGDFEAILEPEGLHSIAARSAAIELIIRMKLESDKMSRAEQPEAYKNAIERVMGAASLDEMKEAVKAASVQTVESFHGTDKSPVVKQVMRHIESRFADALSLKSLGLQYHIHPVYLGHLFHKQTGDTFTDYINKYRIGRAKDLLKESHLKVHEIARQVGYVEPGYFYKQFKKHVGVSPGEYKELL